MDPFKLSSTNIHTMRALVCVSNISTLLSGKKSTMYQPNLFLWEMNSFPKNCSKMFTVTMEIALQLYVTPRASLMQLLQAFLKGMRPRVVCQFISDMGRLDEEDRE